ncbi:MAG: NAD(P)H-binding protein [Phycisphaerales bacterium]|nr:NAD(P)H-binding protein [Phycisphaerales bacterium]
MSVGMVAVTGATGFAGRHVVRELLSRGSPVRALVRDTTKAAQVLPADPHLTLVRGEGDDGHALGELLQGCSAVVNTVGIIREGPGGQTFKRVHVGMTRALTQAAKRSRCERFVQISSLAVSEVGTTGYQRTKFEAETIVRDSGLRWTILRPSLIHGRDGEFMGMARDWATGRIAPYVFMPYFARLRGRFPKPVFESPHIQPVFVEDVARAVAESLERETAVGEVYCLTGAETLTWPELLEFVRDRVKLAKKGIKPFPIPGELAALQAKAASMIGIGALLPFDEGMARMGALDNVAPTVKAREHLGFTPSGFRETAAGYLGAM